MSSPDPMSAPQVDNPGQAAGSPPVDPPKTSDAEKELRRALTDKGEEIKELETLIHTIGQHKDKTVGDVLSFMQTGQFPNSNGNVTQEQLKEVLGEFDEPTQKAFVSMANLIQTSTDARMDRMVTTLQAKLARATSGNELDQGYAQGGVSTMDKESSDFAEFAREQEGDELIRGLAQAPRLKGKLIAERYLAQKPVPTQSVAAARLAGLEGTGTRGGMAGTTAGTITLSRRKMKPIDIFDAKQKGLEIKFTD